MRSPGQGYTPSRTEGRSSAGRALVSKTRGRRFDPCRPCRSRRAETRSVMRVSGFLEPSRLSAQVRPNEPDSEGYWLCNWYAREPSAIGGTVVTVSPDENLESTWATRELPDPESSPTAARYTGQRLRGLRRHPRRDGLRQRRALARRKSTRERSTAMGACGNGRCPRLHRHRLESWAHGPRPTTSSSSWWRRSPTQPMRRPRPTRRVPTCRRRRASRHGA
jgi:hypothetical protein